MNRRDFLKAAGGTALAAASGAAVGRDNLPVLPNAVGMLYDSTLCIGCKACVAACKDANGMPAEGELWDWAVDLSPKTLNVIKAYTDGSADHKDRESDGYAFVKRHCMHCVDAGCVSVCPVNAMRKDPQTGIVSHHPEACIGCRYCVQACPYNVPKYELDKAFGQIQKCQFCNHRLREGKVPACVEVCPTGASLFGTRRELLEEAKRRTALKPGEIYNYPRITLDAPHRHEKPAPVYRSHIFGEKEGGGTQVMHIAAVPFEKLGLPTLPELSYAARSETVQHTLYSGMVLPGVLLAGLLYAAKRSTKDHDDGDEN
jgi:Fe-S-cluster-containing dehydrogenase component